jgi:hypothetical protein
MFLFVIQPFTEGFYGIWFSIYHHKFPGHELGGFLNSENEKHLQFLESFGITVPVPGGSGGEGEGEIDIQRIILPEKPFLPENYQSKVSLELQESIHLVFLNEIIHPVNGGTPRWYHIPFSEDFINSVKSFHLEIEETEETGKKNVYVFYHGTSESSVQTILRDGFKETTEESGMMGRGIYLGDYWKASRYGFRTSDYAKISAGFHSGGSGSGGDGGHLLEGVLPLDDIMTRNETERGGGMREAYDILRIDPCVIRCMVLLDTHKIYQFPNDDVIRKLKIPLAKLAIPSFSSTGENPDRMIAKSKSSIVSWKTHTKAWRSGGGGERGTITESSLENIPVFRGNASMKTKTITETETTKDTLQKIYIIVLAPNVCSLASVFGELICRERLNPNDFTVFSETLIRESMPDFKRNMEVSIDAPGGFVHPDFLEKCQEHLRVLPQLVSREKGHCCLNVFPRTIKELEELIDTIQTTGTGTQKQIVLVHIDAFEPTEDVIEYGGKQPNPSYILASMDARRQLEYIERVREIVLGIQEQDTFKEQISLITMISHPKYQAFQYIQTQTDVDVDVMTGMGQLFGLNFIGNSRMTSAGVPVQYIETPEMYESHIQEYQPWNSLRLLRLNETDEERRVGLRQRQEELLQEIRTASNEMKADCILLKPFRFEYYGDFGKKKYQTGSLSTRVEAVISLSSSSLQIIVLDWASLRLGSSPRNHIPIQGYGFIY